MQAGISIMASSSTTQTLLATMVAGRPTPLVLTTRLVCLPSNERDGEREREKEREKERQIEREREKEREGRKDVLFFKEFSPHWSSHGFLFVEMCGNARTYRVQTPSSSRTGPRTWTSRRLKSSL